MKQVDIPVVDLSSANEIFISLSEVDPPPWIELCRVFCLKALNRIGVTNWEVSLLFCNDAVIRGLNSRFRGYDKATDVLSFPQCEPVVEGNLQVPDSEKWPAGDVVISLDTLQRNAEDNNISEDEELKRLLIHGFLHLKGMDHHEEKSEMLKIQESILWEFMEERII